MNLTKENIEKVFEDKGYRFFTSPLSINVFGIRCQTGTDLFDDLICVAWYDKDNEFQLKTFEATTDPGQHWLKNPMRKAGCAIMVEGQYRGAYAIGRHGRSNGGKGYKAGRQQKAIPVYRDSNKDSNHDLDPSTIEDGIHYTNIHHGWSASKVSRNSAGCQVIKSKSKFEKVFMPLLKMSTDKYGKTFTYTLLNARDFA